MYKSSNMLLFTLIFVCIGSIFVESKTKLGDVVPICSLNDVNVNECLKSSINTIIPQLAKGIKGWNLVSIDPFFVPLIILGQDSGPISIRWEHINTTIAGYGKANITDASVSKKGEVYSFALTALVSKFSMIGQFKARGKMLFFPLKNDGHEEIHSGQFEIRMKFDAKPELKNKEEHLQIQKFTLTMGFTKGVKVIIKNNSKKPTQMDRILSKFLTENSYVIAEEMRPSFEPAFGQILRTYIQSFFNKVPLQDMFKQ